jgi:hypothetical protein
MSGITHPVYVDMLAAGAIVVLLEGGCMSPSRHLNDGIDFAYDSFRPQQTSSITHATNVGCMDDSPNPSEYCL